MSPKNRVSLKPEGKTIDTIDSNTQFWSKINPKKACVSQTRGKNHEDWFYCGFGNSYSKSCYFIDSNHITLKTSWDDTIDCNEQRRNKITSKKGVFVSDQREKP